MPLDRPQTLGEEIANSVSHGIGFLLAIASLPVLLIFGPVQSTAINIVAVCVFSATMMLLYLVSTLYHLWPQGRAKVWLNRFDHAAIYLFIAGSYTPFVLGVLRGGWGWSLFGVVWTIALLGVYLVVRGRDRRALVIALYVGLGWIGLIALGPLVRNLPVGGLWLLFGGGVCYTLGVPFYLSKRLRYNHALWHLFVLAGSILQFFAVLLYVLPDSAVR